VTRLALLATLLMLLAPAGASAATTIGSSIPSYDGETLECTHPDGCTFVPRTIAGTPVVVPHDGILTSWRAALPTSAETGPISMVVLRPDGNGGASRVGATNLGPPPTDGSSNGVSAELPVKAGDLIGVELDNGDEIGIASHPGIESSSWWFEPRLTAARAPDLAETDDFQALFNAQIQMDANGDGRGDENQRLCGGRPCTFQPTLDVTLDQRLVLAGTSIRLHATVTGPNLLPVSNATLTLRMPVQVAAVAAVAATGRGPCQVLAGQVTCPLGRIEKDERIAVDVDLQAREPGNATIWTELHSDTLMFFPKQRASVRVLATGRCSNLGFAPTFAGDRLNGGRAANTLMGLAGDDCLFGLSGDDVLSGGDGSDQLDGGSGRDVLRGDAGNDQLTGGPWSDRLEGGSGNDVIDAIDRKRDLVRCGSGRDRARVDASDSVAGCERVTRVRPKRR
jgi:RTX calcium-binding nonapeptide repeat (4 copies)